jgi:membrane protein DedA with SNARE-associated domain
MDRFVEATISFVQHHAAWGAAIVFLLAFSESFAFVSLLVPATGILFGVGGLMALYRLDFWPMWTAAVLGAFAGDWLAYALTLRFKDRIARLPPLASNPQLMARGIKFFDRWGLLAVFGGRFFGPLRAIVPIVAGLYAMPWIKFQAANLASALLWASAILSPGFFGVRWLVG